MKCTARLRWAIGLAALIAPAAAGAYSIAWYTIDAGGGSSGGNGFSLSGSIGQADAGTPLVGNTYRLVGGFWAGSSGLTLPGDCDGDGDLDLSDHACLAACLSGPDTIVPGECDPYDMDVDGDVDLLDWAIFSTL